MTQEQIKELENLSKETLIGNIILMQSQYQAMLQFAEYLQMQLAKASEPIKACVKASEVTGDPKSENNATENDINE